LLNLSNWGDVNEELVARLGSKSLNSNYLNTKVDFTK
jgi:hypothetical protein